MTAPDAADLVINLGTTSSDGRSEVFVHIAGQLEHSDRFNLVSERSRSKFLKSCRERIPGLTEEHEPAIRARLLELLEVAGRESTSAVASPRTYHELAHQRDEQALALLEGMPTDAIEGAERMLEDPRLLERIHGDFDASGIVGEHQLRIALYLIGTSRLLASPVSAIVQGQSSSGKSFVVERAATFMPQEGCLRATDLTSNALYYVPEDALVHVMVVAGERAHRKDDEQAETTRALREMISSRVLRKCVPRRTEPGEFVTEVIERYGPIAYVETTTKTRLFDEDSNRVLLLASDESEAQTRRILEAAAKRAASGASESHPVVQRHHALQRLLRRVDVRTPYASAIASRMPAQRPEARRAIGHVMSLIDASALLFQRQRLLVAGSLECGGVIEAIVEDYALARELLVGPLGRLLGGDLPPAVYRFGSRLLARGWQNEFLAKDAASADPQVASQDVARRYLKSLCDAGVVSEVEVGRGGRPTAFRVVGDLPEPGATWLPTVDDIQSDLSGHEEVCEGVPLGRQGRQLTTASGTGPAILIPQESCRPSSSVASRSPGSPAPRGVDDRNGAATP